MIRWLGQVSFALEPGHVYRGRWLIPCPPGCAWVPGVPERCPNGPFLDSVRNALLAAFPQQIRDVSTFELRLPIGNPYQLPADWPNDRKTVTETENPNHLCVIFTQFSPTQNFSLDSERLLRLFSPMGGQLVNFWDQTNGQRLIDEPSYSCLPGQFWNPITRVCETIQIPPILPPIQPPTIPPIIQPPATQPPTTQPPTTTPPTTTPPTTPPITPPPTTPPIVIPPPIVLPPGTTPVKKKETNYVPWIVGGVILTVGFVALSRSA